MKFPRHARIFRGRPEAAPFATVVLLLLLFVLLASLVYTPGLSVPLALPQGGNLPGTDKLSVAVAMDASGGLYYQNLALRETELTRRLRRAVEAAGQPVTLIIMADKRVEYEKLVRLRLLAREAGIQEILEATLPPPLASPTRPANE
jgi:biopolymer transport protein ExbD